MTYTPDGCVRLAGESDAVRHEIVEKGWFYWSALEAGMSGIEQAALDL